MLGGLPKSPRNCLNEGAIMPDAAVTAFRKRLAREAGPALWNEIERAANARIDVRGEHADWARLAEEAGLLNLAFREFQLALRDDPKDAVAAFRLAHHYRERGDTGRAAALLERLLASNPAREDWLRLYVDVLHDDGATPKIRAALDRAVQAGLPNDRAAALGRVEPDDHEAGDDGTLSPSDADCVRFATLFAGREDAHARQWANRGGDSGYSPVHEPFTSAVARNHLLGSYTVGIYPIRLDGTCTFFALDLDVEKWAIEQARTHPDFARQIRADLRAHARRLLEMLRGLGFAPLFEDSGYKGRHLWVFLEQPEPAEVLHQFGRQLLAWQGPLLSRGLHLEFFPKQGRRDGKGMGNLIKLPMGIHRRTGRRAALLDDDGQPLPQPLAALRRVAKTPRTVLYAAVERLKGTAGAAPPARTEQAAEQPPAIGPPPPEPPPGWTEADFQADPRMRHLLRHCPVLAELKRSVDEHRRLNHEEQLVLIHTLGHVEGGPQAVNYLLGKCLDVGPEKLMKDRLKGNPVSCPSIRKKIGHITRRVPCNCPFDFAPDRYPTPVLHLLTLPADTPPATSPADAATLARRYAASALRLAEIQREHQELARALAELLRLLPERTVVCPGGRYRLIERDGVEELLWEEEASGGPQQPPPPPADNQAQQPPA
jgi:tetratricopeptide (TPR) repeat protein